MSTIVDKTFPKSQRLYSHTDFQWMFSKGQSFYFYPFVCYYHIVDKVDSFESKVAVSVSKKRFKHAVDRNRIKRLVREAYRQNKHLIYNTLQHEDIELHVIFVYTERKILPYYFINKKMISLINKLLAVCGKKNDAE